MEAVFFVSSTLISIEIPLNVETIKGKAFCNCKELKLVTFCIYSKLNETYDQSFYRAAFESIDIPVNVISIRDDVFNDCKYLRSITFFKD